MLLLLLPHEGDYAINPEDAKRLAELGVSSVSLMRDDEGVGVVLEGWAFDPVRSGRDALAILTHGRGIARTLRSVMHVALDP